MKGPLDGVTVIDAGHIMAGPYCSMILGDLGADVIKVEKPAGDDTRRFGPPFINGESAAYLAVNRNKRGIALNLKTDDGREVFRELVRQADVLVENYKPGTMARLGLGYDDLRAINPGLIYCSITGFGQNGPYRDRRGFDLVAQAMSGLMSVTGTPDGVPVKVGVPITDLGAGLYAAQAVLAAYIHKLRTGEGQYLDISLLDAGISLMVWESAAYFGSGEIPEPLGSAHRMLAPYQAFPTADKPIVIGAGNQRGWIRLCEMLGREDLLQDERFATNELRVVNQRALAEELTAVFETETAARWLERLEAAGVPAGPVYNMQDVYGDEHVLARGMKVQLEHPTAGAINQIGSPLKMSATPATLRRPAPTLGQHSREILAELGRSEKEIQQLIELDVARSEEVGAGSS